MCGKAFFDKYGLQNHVKNVHETGENPKNYVCHKCGVAYNTSSTLKGKNNVEQVFLNDFLEKVEKQALKSP